MWLGVVHASPFATCAGFLVPLTDATSIELWEMELEMQQRESKKGRERERERDRDRQTENI